MISAAEVSSLRVLRTRAASRSWSVRPSAALRGIMLTPVSNPDRPRTRSGKAARAGSRIPPKPPPPEVSRSIQVLTAPGVRTTAMIPATTTTALSSRKTATSGIATDTASVNPFRNTAPRINRSTIVTATWCPCRKDGKNGFWIMCTLASAADRVIVMIHEVATNPSSTSTKILPRQNGSRCSSMATEPCPWGLSFATRRYIGSMPRRGRATMSSVASGESAPAASAAMPGRYDSVEKEPAPVSVMPFHHACPCVCSSPPSGPSGWTRCWSSHRLMRCLGWEPRPGLSTHAGTASSTDVLMRSDLPRDDPRAGPRVQHPPQSCPASGTPGCSGAGFEPGQLGGEVAGVDDAEPLGGPGERDVEVVVPAHALVEDPARVDDEHRVELQALGALRRQDHRTGGQVRGRPGRRAREPRPDRLGHGRQPAAGDDDGQRAVLLVQFRRGLGDRVRQSRLGNPERPRAYAGRTHGASRGRGRPARTEDLRGHLHDLGGGPVVDRELLQPPRAAQVRLQDLPPARRAGQGAGLRHIADDGHRAGGTAAQQQPPGHRRELLCLVDDDVPVGPRAVGGGPFGRRAGVGLLLPLGEALGVEQVAGGQLLGLLLALVVQGARAVQQVEVVLRMLPPALPLAAGGGPLGRVVDAEQLVGLLQQRDVGRGPGG